MTMIKAQEGTKVLPGNLHVPDECRAISEMLSRVGDKWTVLVITSLGGGSKRFGELRKALGSISARDVLDMRVQTPIFLDNDNRPGVRLIRYRNIGARRPVCGIKR